MTHPSVAAQKGTVTICIPNQTLQDHPPIKALTIALLQALSDAALTKNKTNKADPQRSRHRKVAPARTEGR